MLNNDINIPNKDDVIDNKKNGQYLAYFKKYFL